MRDERKECDEKSETDMTLEPCLIERELLREKIYCRLRADLCGLVIDKMKYKEVSNVMLRYLFNKIRLMQDDGNSDGENADADPVFCGASNAQLAEMAEAQLAEAQLAEEQVRRDLRFHHVKEPVATHFVNALVDGWKNAATVVKDSALELAKHNVELSKHQVELRQTKLDAEPRMRGRILYYRQRSWFDVQSLAQRNPQYLRAVVALHIRYEYIELKHHGLARKFAQMGLKPNDALECFASAFNHYFHRYCSAFPDLERYFGSLGSFWALSTQSLCEKETLVFVNPPFDDSLMEAAAKRVTQHIHSACKDSKESREKDAAVTGRKWVFTLPNWTDFAALDHLKNSPYLASVKRWPKGTLPFVDHMDKQQIVYPCDIVEVMLRG